MPGTRMNDCCPFDDGRLWSSADRSAHGSWARGRATIELDSSLSQPPSSQDRPLTTLRPLTSLSPARRFHSLVSVLIPLPPPLCALQRRRDSGSSRLSHGRSAYGGNAANKCR